MDCSNSNEEEDGESSSFVIIIILNAEVVFFVFVTCFPDRDMITSLSLLLLLLRLLRRRATFRCDEHFSFRPRSHARKRSVTRSFIRSVFGNVAELVADIFSNLCDRRIVS